MAALFRQVLGRQFEKIRKFIKQEKNKEMNNQHFNCSITANISASEALKKISHVPGWWKVTFSGSAEKQNDKFTVGMGGDSVFNFTVTELIPGKRIVWLVTDCYLPWYADKKEWTNTRLIFDLEENNGATSIHFTHEGLIPGIECYNDCEKGWNHWIKTSLLSCFSTEKNDVKPAIFGNHSSVIVPHESRDGIRKFYCDVLGGTITKAEKERDFLRLGDNFYIGFLYAEVADESAFLRSARSAWLEIKSDNVEAMSQKILESGLVTKLDIPDPHLYFQAPGGQVWRLVGTSEDMSFYEGAGDGPDVAKVKEAVAKKEKKQVAEV